MIILINIILTVALESICCGHDFQLVYTVTVNPILFAWDFLNH